MKNERLMYQLFIGKVSEVIGVEKTMQLLKEAKDAFNKPEPPPPPVDREVHLSGKSRRKENA